MRAQITYLEIYLTTEAEGGTYCEITNRNKSVPMVDKFRYFGEICLLKVDI